MVAGENMRSQEYMFFKDIKLLTKQECLVDGTFGRPKDCRFLMGLTERQMGKQAPNPHLQLLAPGHMDHERKSKSTH